MLERLSDDLKEVLTSTLLFSNGWITFLNLTNPSGHDLSLKTVPETYLGTYLCSVSSYSGRQKPL